MFPLHKAVLYTVSVMASALKRLYCLCSGMDLKGGSVIYLSDVSYI